MGLLQLCVYFAALLWVELLLVFHWCVRSEQCLAVFNSLHSQQKGSETSVSAFSAKQYLLHLFFPCLFGMAAAGTWTSRETAVNAQESTLLTVVFLSNMLVWIHTFMEISSVLAHWKVLLQQRNKPFTSCQLGCCNRANAWKPEGCVECGHVFPSLPAAWLKDICRINQHRDCRKTLYHVH